MRKTIYQNSFDKNEGDCPLRIEIFVDGDEGIVAEFCNVRFSEYLKGAGQTCDIAISLRRTDEKNSAQNKQETPAAAAQLKNLRKTG